MGRVRVPVAVFFSSPDAVRTLCARGRDARAAALRVRESQNTATKVARLTAVC
jgi:hypothetical protein